MKIFASTKPIKPQQGKVSTHAVTMFLAIDHFTLRGLRLAPTPMIEAVEQCEVETGMPVRLETRRVITVPKLAATP